jgi:protein tyrosine/serine phosphatase
MRASFAFLLLRLAALAFLIAGPVAFAHHRQNQTRNFRIVRPGVLYRSGQMSLAGLERLVDEYGFRTVVSLRDSYVAGGTPPDLKEEAFCRKMDILHVRISPRAWESPTGGPAPVEEGVRRFLEVMADRRNYPVLVHCFAGVHRTGAYCAIYRMEFQGWSNAEALAEMKACGYDNLDDEWDIRNFLDSYRPGERARIPEETKERRTN